MCRRPSADALIRQKHQIALEPGHAATMVDHRHAPRLVDRQPHPIALVLTGRDLRDSPRENVFAAWLAIGKDQAVVSHESALDLWELSDVVPAAVHLTVPRFYRSRTKRSLSGVVIHTTSRELVGDDVRRQHGIRLTSPERTLLDAAEDGTQPEQIERAIGQAFSRGWIDPARLRERAAQRGTRVANLIARTLAAAEATAQA